MVVVLTVLLPLMPLVLGLDDKGGSLDDGYPGGLGYEYNGR